ncbi:peptidoglycan-binding protein [Lentilitoribacter sp. Alg239-R112]|uniref:peptidoglycan-binding domain-containing protein n=1 Tax=Lentilitoribacter sp. Alg239-R112 TaxID=2305987 RepID=UPI0013A6B8DF|nr:peptidoglycan-binding protein [Lentilitoribacter sp. Alg239-R112]
MSHRAGPIHVKRERDSFFSELLSSVGQLVVKHPSIVGGGTAFIIIFSFIASNALHYQKTEHPAPILNMRGPQHLISGSTRPIPSRRTVERELMGVKGENGTTYRVSHSDDIQTSSVKLPVPVLTKERSALEQRVVEPQDNDEFKGDTLVLAIQRELSEQNIYLDSVDGLTGPNTRAAIKKFQIRHGYPIDVTVSKKMLQQIKKVSARKEAGSPAKPKANEISNSQPLSNEMVRKIQIGLKKAAYPDIEVDGLIGEETRNAIRLFEKHYRLPVTGSPSQVILDTLKSTGAL